MGKFSVIDLETTGHSPEAEDKIIEVGIVVIEAGEIVEKFSSFVNPRRKIPSFITQLTGITEEDVVQAPTFNELADRIQKLLQDSYLIAHNVPFDFNFLNTELTQAGYLPLANPTIDTVELSRILLPQASGFQLNQLAQDLNIRHDAPHRALSDAETTAKLFLILKEKLNSLPYETLTHLLRLEAHLQSNLTDILQKCQEQAAFKSDDRIQVYKGLAFRKAKEETENELPTSRSFTKYLDQIYGETGALKKHLAGYENRSGQRLMSERVFEAFQNDHHLLIEAGTGIGKTISYLISAAYKAVQSKERIVISTHTTQLQHQLLEEDIPILKKILPFPIKTALLKGKQHYISLSRFHHELKDNNSDNYDISLTKAILLVWLTETLTGDIDEIQLPTSGYYFFQRISASNEKINPSSPWFSQSYYQKALKKARSSDLIITNHALLALDLLKDYKLLPSYKKAVIDEAHHFEQRVSQYSGIELSYLDIHYTLMALGSTTDGKWIQENLPYLQTAYETWDQTFTKTKELVDTFFRYLFQYVLDQHPANKTHSDTGRIQYRFFLEKEAKGKWQEIIDIAKDVNDQFSKLISLLHLFDDQNLSQEDFADQQNLLLQIQTFIEQIEELFIKEDGHDFVKWIEIEPAGAKNAVFLFSEPTDISKTLTDQFFKQKESIVLTSATLRVRDSFSFIKERLGLPKEKTKTSHIASPFPYEQQVQLFVPKDFPLINDQKGEEYILALAEALLSLVRVTEGRMLVLFTSYDMLRRVYMILKEMLDEDFYLIAQGISSNNRSRLKKNFQTFEQSILLGTTSFWEGIDLPGDALSCVVIARLPFSPPNHPVFEAKEEHIKAEGGNAFMEWSLPQAVIRFKQGFGRLIRSAEDRGIVFVGDTRLITARYGHFFLRSIPKIPIYHETTHQLIRRAEEWFKK